MKFTDTHTHLYSEEFDNQQDEMMFRALESGVEKLFVPAIDSSYTQKMYEVKAKYPKNVFLMIGLHPCYVKPETYKDELAFVESELEKNKFVAIGEIGIDLYWDKTTLHIQQEAFQKQIQLAKKFNLPINIHCREAFDEVFEVLEKEKGPGLFGIFHCFSGNFEQAQKAISYNLKLGIGGVVTFKNGKIDQFINQIPLEHLVLETDAPYLAPAPFRGKRNESSYVSLVAKKLADLYGLSLEEIAEQTNKNANVVFGV